MGEPATLRATFRPSLRVEAGRGCLSSFGGVAYLREVEERAGFLRELICGLEDPRSAARSSPRCVQSAPATSSATRKAPSLEERERA